MKPLDTVTSQRKQDGCTGRQFILERRIPQTAISPVRYMGNVLRAVGENLRRFRPSSKSSYSKGTLTRAELDFFLNEQGTGFKDLKSINLKN